LNKRGAGICFCMISAFLFALVVVTNLVIFNASNWTSEDIAYKNIMFLEHLCVWLSVISLIAGALYILREELEEFRNKKKSV
jgi:hypothetical protein